MTRENKSSVGSQEVGLKVDISVVLDSAGERFDSHFLRIETALDKSARRADNRSVLHQILAHLLPNTTSIVRY